MTAPKPKAERLHWIKYNPNEWLGTYPELSDEEYGLFHRVIAKLWSVPGNRLTRESLLSELRVRPNSKRARLINGLIGYALKVDAEGLLFVTAIDDAFADATKRGNAGAAGANARWEKAKTENVSELSETPPNSSIGNSADF